MYSPTERRDNQHIFSELDDLERHALVTDITRIAPHMNNVSRNGFWELWLADISKLKYYKDYALRYESADKSRRMDIIFRSEHGDDSLGLTSPILLDKRLQSIRPVSSNEQAAINRDKSQCVLTNSRATTVHPTHMVPTYLHEVTEESKNYQWYIYEDLFGRERVQRWRDAIMTSMICRDTGNTGRIHNTDRPENMISLDKQARRYWQDDMCAFRPVSLSEDKTSMELAFTGYLCLYMEHAIIMGTELSSDVIRIRTKD
ncbi:hypothetical protein N7456_009326 [Penicillium angulare]|uniref:HNH nuclease domain-containing protein n=1 Tax=Penicillium angulare TaxID=116970 RepID=A0A9W9K5F9_9EURO|nr:hypothetical protein N7456_009326 [Penicillium angulare]